MRWPLPRLNLVTKVALISLLPVLAIGWVLQRDLADTTRREAIHDARQLAINVTDLRIAPAVTRADLTATKVPPARAARLDRVLRSALAATDVKRVKLWNRQGRVVFSNDEGLEGRRFPIEDDLGEALEGEVSAELTSLDEAENRRDRRFGQMVEAYVPLRLAGDREPVGAFEVYVPYRAVAARVEREARHTFLVLALGLAALWALLLPIVLGASRRLRRQSRENRHQATHDRLTGLPNRDAFIARLERVAHHGEGSVAILDLDRFKEINDTLGHPVGDRLIQEVGPRLREAYGPGTMVARIGGDEFALLFEHPDGDPQRAVAALATPFDLQGLSVHVDGSVGVARFPEHGTDATDLLRHADVAMYDAKHGARGVSVYAPENDTADADRLLLLGELRAAIDAGQLRLHFQPKFDLRTGRMVGVEALVRWQHPRRGLLPPVEFVPAAERTGLIGPLTTWVLDEALGRCRAWRDAGHDLSVAVNLSVANLTDPQLPHLVEQLLERHALPADALELEVTESAAMTDPEGARATLDRLATMGIALAVDDYGTGQSSLAYLQRLPVSELKIDRAFVARMTESAGDEGIVRSTIEMAHHLGLTVVAEGIETREVTERLRQLGCDTGQGFHLGRPVPPERIDAELAAEGTQVTPA